jgi:hypothetical protein
MNVVPGCVGLGHYVGMVEIFKSSALITSSSCGGKYKPQSNVPCAKEVVDSFTGIVRPFSGMGFNICLSFSSFL